MLPKRIFTLNELMSMDRADQLRYRWTDADSAYVLEPGKVVGGVFLPEVLSDFEIKQLNPDAAKYYVYLDNKRKWYLLEADNV